MRIRPLLLVGCLCLIALNSSAQPKSSAPTIAKTGWIDDAKLEKSAPPNGVIVSQKALENLLKAWKLDKDVPKVDFTKEIVIVMTGKGQGAFGAFLDKTDLKTTFGGPPEKKAGFAYIVQSVSREGVKTVNGKPLPKQ